MSVGHLKLCKKNETTKNKLLKNSDLEKYKNYMCT